MSGLDLNKTAVVTDDVEDAAAQAFVRIDEIKAHIQDVVGLKAYPKPDEHPPGLVDIDINSMTNPELGTVYAKYVAFQAYLSTEVAEAEIRKDAASRNLKQVDAEIRNQLHAKGTKDSQIVSLSRTHPLYREYDVEYAKCRYIYVILAAYYKAYEKQAAALSRVVELRKLEFEQNMRESSVGGHRVKHGGMKRPHRRPESMGIKPKTSVPKVRGRK
jgi:hypothetical protein